mmetsp:Transcript_96327/g.276573  ORF Transcript_96327/g.276573 Transcript_96327/m.276573 type:complete len:254 (-) Transcript_96327:570-1331(-)
MAHAQNILVRPKPDTADSFARVLLLQVGGLRPGLIEDILPDLQMRAKSNAHQASHGNVNVSSRIAVRLERMHGLVLSKIPHLPIALCARREHVIAMDCHAGHMTCMAEHLHDGSFHRGRPHCHAAVGVAYVHDTIGRILPQAASWSQFRPVVCDLLARGDVTVVQVSQIPCRHKQEVVWQEVQMRGIPLVLDAVDLHPLGVVHVHVLFLRDCVQRVVVHGLHCSDRLFQLKLALNLHGITPHHRDMPFSAPYQ